MSRVTGLLLTALVAVLTACGSSGPATPPGPSIGAAGTPEVYVDLGASDALGVGIPDDALRLRDSWPQLFFNAALPRASTYYNLGLGGETVSAALIDEMMQATALHPTVATVWFNVDDLARGVTPVSYERDLGILIRSLRQSGALVLVANTPVLDHLPAYLACVTPTPGRRCLIPAGVLVPDGPTLNRRVDDFNAAVARVAAQERATVVDLHAQGEVPDTHPDWVGTDGFHPSAQGYAQVARLFTEAYRQARAQPL